MLFTLTLHLENADAFDATYFAELEDFAGRVEAHGGRLTFEPRSPVTQAAAGPPPLLDWRTLEARGHSVGSHAAIGGTQAMPLDVFSAQAALAFDTLAPHVDRLDHVSGNCGDVDWVSGVVAAGFRATTAATVGCLLSIPEDARPTGYASLSCSGADDASCHAPYPSELVERIHPWRARDGATWLTDDPAGELVVFPSSGSLPCLEEEAQNPNQLVPCTLTAEDVSRALADLDAAIVAAGPDQLATYYWVWGSFGLSADEAPVFEDLLVELDQRVASGQIAWASLGEMLAAYEAWESVHR